MSKVVSKLATCNVQSISATQSSFAAICFDKSVITWGDATLAPLLSSALPTRQPMPVPTQSPTSRC
jgi:hypothetical protein